MKLLLDQIVHTDYGQFDLVWSESGGFDGDHNRYFAGHVNGLVGAGGVDGVYVNLARRSGGSCVRVVLHEEAQGDPDPEWEDVVEVSITVPGGRPVSWMSWAGETSGTLDVPPGAYRLRVSAKGRDAGAEGEFADGVVDEYLLELWPQSHGDEVIVRSGSENARYWHAELGGRR